MNLRIVLLLLATAFALSACGNKGPLRHADAPEPQATPVGTPDAAPAPPPEPEPAPLPDEND